MAADEAMSALSKRGAASRKRVMDCAAGLFSRHGYAATAMRDIAKAADFNVGAIYHHFPSKEELLLAVETEAFRQMTERVTTEVALYKDAWDRLEAACRAHLQGVLLNREYVNVTSRELPRDHSPKIRQSIRKLRESYENIFRDLVSQLNLDPDVNPSIFRLTLLGAMAWSLVWYRPDRGTPDEVAAQMVRLLRSGVE